MFILYRGNKDKAYLHKNKSGHKKQKHRLQKQTAFPLHTKKIRELQISKRKLGVLQDYYKSKLLKCQHILGVRIWQNKIILK